jgi:asparaginyl-tRNA synthetase
MHTKIKQLKSQDVGKEFTIKGWIRSVRIQSNFAFIAINDGSTFDGMQAILDETVPSYEDILKNATTGSSISATGVLVESLGKGQLLELKTTKIEIIGTCSVEDYPLQKKRHSFEFLRKIAHLRPRTNTFGAVTRVRNALSFATHKFFQDRGFFYIHTPIITGSDCEGAGEMFRTTTMDLAKPEKNSSGAIDFSKDFFKKEAFLTVSGQLNVEAFCCSMSDVYTFGPTFRAENSNTSRHLSEFWMIEPEIAFADLSDDIDCVENYLKFCVKYVLENCSRDIDFFDKFISKGLAERLSTITKESFERISYTQAVDILKTSKQSFQYPVEWGKNLQTEHERYLAEQYFKKPLAVTDYPKEIKSFYMRTNDDNKTVAAVDILVPEIGELVGGSQREERLDLLEQRLIKLGLPKDDYEWYIDLRRFGTVKHAGFGVGFERLVQFVTGMENIRDVIPFPRSPGTLNF